METHDITAYIDKLYAAAIRKTQNVHLAEDLTQETCLAALQAMAKGKQPEHMWSWLQTILSNKHCDYLRNKYNKPQISFELYSLDIPEEPEPEDDFPEQWETIRRELGYLAHTYREAMVRHYLYGESLEAIAARLNLPIGTVKSRLYAGRQKLKERIADMDHHSKQNYIPDKLSFGYSGSPGLENEPLSLVPPSDLLAQNVLLRAYEKPLSVSELAQSLEVPAAFLEPVIDRLVDGELMQRTASGLVYTDFIIFQHKDRTLAFQKHLALSDAHFSLFWEPLSAALCSLRQQSWYLRLYTGAAAKLELYFCIDVLVKGLIEVREQLLGALPFSEYPYRKNGGRWLATGIQITKDADPMDRYTFHGEWVCETHTQSANALLKLRGYNTILGRYPNTCIGPAFVEWFYDLHNGNRIDPDLVPDQVLPLIDKLRQSSILRSSPMPELDIPVLYEAEYAALQTQVDRCLAAMRDDLRPLLLSLFDTAVRLPTHLKSVPKTFQYQQCGEAIPMAIIHKARESGAFLQNMDTPIPATLLVVNPAK